MLNGGTISNTAITAAAGTLNIGNNAANLLTGVTVNGDLNLNVTSAVTRIAGGTTFTTAHLAANAASLGFAPGQTLTGTVSFEGAVAGVRYVEMNGSPGTFTVGATGIIQTTAGLTGDGNIGGSHDFGGAMTLANQGLISSQVSGRTITIAPSSLSNTGTLSASNGGILTIAPTNNWTNAGTISVNASTVNLGGTFDATGGIGTWSNTGGTVNINGTILNTASTLTLNSSTGSWMLNGGTISGGALGFANGQTLLIASNAANLLTGVTVNGDLTLNVTSAATRIAGGTTFTTAHLAANAASLGFAPGQTLAGTVSFEGAVAGVRHVEMNGSPGTFTVGATGIIQTTAGLTGDGNIGGSQNYGGAMTLANQGLISSQVSGRTITIASSSLSNTGTLSASNGGILTIAPTNNWTNAGTISVNASTVNLGGTFDATGGIGTWSNTGGTVNINGTILNTASTLTLNSSTGSWTLNGGTISGGMLGFANGQTLSISNITANLLTGVTVNGDLTLNVTSAATKIAGGTTFTTAHLAANAVSLGFAPGQTLAGTVSFEGAVAGVRFVEMNGSPGAFTVGATGIIQTTAGLTGDGNIGGNQNFGGAMTLANQGLISSQVSGRTITIASSSLSNTGTLSASNGGILTITGTLTNNVAGVLTGGTYISLAGGVGATLTASGNAITQIAANTTVELSGAGSVFQVATTSLETSLLTNNGTLKVLNNRNYSTSNAFANGATTSDTALLQLGGGTFDSSSLVNQVLSTIIGFGSITPRPTNHGLIEASGGTLAFANGILGGSGTVQIDADGTLDLSGGSQRQQCRLPQRQRQHARQPEPRCEQLHRRGGLQQRQFRRRQFL